MDKKISIYVQLYYDLDFLEDILIYLNNFVDEIVIVDGPYSYCVEFLRKCNLLYDENTKPIKLNNIIEKFKNKISYYYSIWENEKQKRMFGYEKCKYENVLLVDGDELFNIDKSALEEYINSDKCVAGFHIYNMNRININIDNISVKNIMFKKSRITAHQHLSYTWLVGVDGLEPQNNNNVFTKNKLGVIFHQTLNRTKQNNIVKYIFYSRLYYKNANINEINKIFGFEFDLLLTKMNINEILNVFYRSALEFIGVHPNKIMKMNNNVSIDLHKYRNNHIEGFFEKNTKILRNVSYNCYFDIKKDYNTNDTIKIKIITENIKNMTVIFYELCLNKQIDTHRFENIQTGNIIDNYNNTIIDIKLNNNTVYCIGYAITINCSYTIDNDIICNIKNIKIVD